MEKSIDYVVPMVFNDDEEWRSDFGRVKGVYDESDPYSFVRYRSWGTERLLIRCVKRFMPFVRTIYIILAKESQWMNWMEDDKVRVVYHKNFVPERFLPTFNSRTIEMFLCRIPGLSERFLYGNDDMFPVSLLTEEDFFDGNLPILHYTEKEFPTSPNNFHLACRNGLNFVAKEFGKGYGLTWIKGFHGITPMLKSTWIHLWERGGKEIEASITPFREINNYNQWLCPWWHYLSGNYTEGSQRGKYVSTKNTIEEVREAIRDAEGVVCVNDNECVKNYKVYADVVRDELNKKLNLK